MTIADHGGSEAADILEMVGHLGFCTVFALLWR